MVRVTAAFSRARTVEAAAAELAGSVESSLQGPNEVAGGLLLATAATGRDAHAIGRVLGRRWPEAELLGTSFEGVLSRGRVWRDEPAVGLFAWREAAGETPIPVCLPPESTGGDRLADLTAAVGSGPQPDRSEADPARGDDGDPRGLLLLFPDCLEPPSQLEGVLTGLARTVIVAGAAASGIDGRAAAAWLGEESLPAATIGVFVPRSCDREAPGRVRLAGASRFASPWLEVDACHGHWVDRLEGEPPLVWVRRQLGLESDSPVESLLDRLLVRVRDPVWVLRDRDRLDEDDESWIEHFVVGVDPEAGLALASAPASARRPARPGATGRGAGT